MNKKRINKAIVYVFVSIFVFLAAQDFVSAQNKENKLRNVGIGISGGYGVVAHSNNFVKGINADNKKIEYMAPMSLKITKEIDGSEPWQYYYNGLYYGVGLFHGIFNYSENLGNPFAIYGILGFRFLNAGWFSLKAEMAVGFSGIWDAYDEKDRYNIAIGTPIESYIHAGLEAGVSFSKHFQGNIGASFIHFSNGNMRQPNKGINALCPTIGLTYFPDELVHFSKADRRNYFEQHGKEKFKGFWQSEFNVNFARKGIYVFYDHPLQDGTMKEDTARDAYFIMDLQARFARKLARNHALGIGADLSYNQSIGRNSEAYYYPGNRKDDLDFGHHLTFSLFASYEYNIHRFSLLFEPGFYVYKHKDGYLPNTFERIALRYELYKGIFAQLGIRAYDFRKADYIEWGVGYRIEHRKQQ